MSKEYPRCPNCGKAKGHAQFCQQKAVWELEERVSKLEEQLQKAQAALSVARLKLLGTPNREESL